MDIGLGDKGCRYGEKVYAAGSELCPVDDECMVCIDGEWKDRITGESAFYPTAGTPLEE